MSKPLFLSNSQVDTYLTCNRKWHIDKVQKIRPTYLASPLYFGSLLDDTVEHYLLKGEGSWQDYFMKRRLEFEVNRKPKMLPQDLLSMSFGAGDCDDKLIDQSELDKFCDSLGIDHVNAKEYLAYCKQQRKSKTALQEDEQRIFNYCAFLSLTTKGMMLLEKLIEWLDENVAEVISVQKKIEITNGEGDKFIGYLDFVVMMKTDCTHCDGTGLMNYEPNVHEMGGDYPEFIDCPHCSPRKVLIDLKTSSNPKLYYPEDAASTSRQLGIYSQEEGIPEVAYLIADKKIRVREPRVRLSFVEGVITEEHLDDVFAEIEEVTLEIKEKLGQGEKAFEKNEDSCFKYGKCQYHGKCFGGSMKGLEQV